MNSRKNFLNRLWIVLLGITLSAFGTARAQTASIIYISDTVLCTGDSFKVVYISTGFDPECIARVQMSNVSGTFGGAFTVGLTLDSSSNDTIVCTVPTSLPSGTAYKLRLFLDSPAHISPITSATLDVYNHVTPSPSYTKLCVGDTLKLTDTNTMPGLIFAWKGPIMSSSRDTAIPNATASLTGTYVLDITNGACVSTATLFVNVDSTPSKPVISSLTTKCEGDSIRFTIIQTPGTSYTWSGPAGFNPTVPNPVINNLSLSNGGTYIVTVTGTNGCDASDTQAIAVNQKPLKPESSVQNPVCSGGNLALTVNTPTAGATYRWIGPLTDSVQNPVFANISTAHSGNYIVIATMGSCTNRDTVNVVVNQTPATPDASFENGCAGDTLRLIATPSSGGIFSWFDSAGFSQAALNGIALRPNSTIAMSGRYFVAVTSGAGCISDTAFVDVVIEQAPEKPLIEHNNPYCAGRALAFSATSTTPGVIYSWTGPNGFNSSNNNVRLPLAHTDMSGQYIVKAHLGQCSSESTLELVVNPYNTPAVTVSAEPGTELSKATPVTFRANAINAGTAPKYQWMKNGIDIPGATTEMYSTVAGTGILDKDAIGIKITSNASCPLPDSIVSYIFNVSVQAGINNAGEVNDFRIYPNPVSGMFKVKGKLNSDNPVEARIINLIGAVIQTDIILQPVNKTLDHPINTSGLPPGIYVLQLKADEQLLNIRFTVRN